MTDPRGPLRRRHALRSRVPFPNMRCWMWLSRTGAHLALYGLCLFASACERATARPSIVLVSIDTLRADHVGLYGYPRDTTPFLDAWSRNAVVFEHAFTPFPWTLVAHMTMLTGLYPEQHGVTRADRALSKEIPLLAERLKAAGYRTVGLYYSFVWLNETRGFGRGFDVFRSHEDAEELGEHLLAELDALGDERPFFLFMHVFDVHSGPFRPGDRSLYPSPPPFQDLFLEKAADRLPAIPSWEVWESKDLLDDAQVEALVALYDGGVRHVDSGLEVWFGELERRGLLENTLVIVTADHGEALMQRGLVTGHGDLWDEGLRVPLVVRHPRGLMAGQRVGAPVHLGDIVPTILDVAGLGADARLPGRSLFGELSTDRVIYGGGAPREYVLRWPVKVVHLGPDLYFQTDLEADPGETRPRAATSDQFERLRTTALDASWEYPPPLRIPRPSREEVEELRNLGYGGEFEEDR